MNIDIKFAIYGNAVTSELTDFVKQGMANNLINNVIDVVSYEIKTYDSKIHFKFRTYGTESEAVILMDIYMWTGMFMRISENRGYRFGIEEIKVDGYTVPVIEGYKFIYL